MALISRSILNDIQGRLEKEGEEGGRLCCSGQGGAGGGWMRKRIDDSNVFSRDWGAFSQGVFIGHMGVGMQVQDVEDLCIVASAFRAGAFMVHEMVGGEALAAAVVAENM